jgi:hypothetical protein
MSPYLVLFAARGMPTAVTALIGAFLTDALVYAAVSVRDNWQSSRVSSAAARYAVFAAARTMFSTISGARSLSQGTSLARGVISNSRLRARIPAMI